MRKSLLGLCILSALAGPAFAAEPSTAEQRIEALEARIQALETELQQIKAQSVAATVAPAAATSAEAEVDALAANPDDVAASDTTASVAAPAGESSGGSNANAFNPALSIILNGS